MTDASQRVNSRANFSLSQRRDFCLPAFYALQLNELFTVEICPAENVVLAKNIRDSGLRILISRQGEPVGEIGPRLEWMARKYAPSYDGAVA